MLQSCSYLQVILLRRCIHVDDSCLEKIASTSGSRLVQLNVSGCPLVTDQGLTYLGQHCKNLKAINLSGTQVSGF